MRHARFGGRLAAVLCISQLLSLPSAPLFVYANHEDFVTEESFSTITITNRTETSVLVGIEWKLYRIGSWNEEISLLSDEITSDEAEQPGHYQLEEQFEGFPVILNELSDEEWQNAAYTLENEAVVKNYVPDRTGISDENGEIYFEEIPDGLYLLSGKRLLEDDMLYTSSPVLVEVEGEELHISITPEIHPLTESEALHSVRIDWLNDESFMDARSDSIIVYIYKDGWFYDTAELDASNNWETTWTGEADAEWRVEESDIPNGYTVTYQKEGTHFIIRNTYSHITGEGTEQTTPAPPETTTNSIETTTETTQVETTSETTTETILTEATTTTTESITTTTESTTETETTTIPAVTAPPASSTTTKRKRTSSGAGVSNVVNTTDSNASGNKSGTSGTESTSASGISGSSSSENSKDAPPETGQSFWLEIICVLSGLVCVAAGHDVFYREKQQ